MEHPDGHAEHTTVGLVFFPLLTTSLELRLFVVALATGVCLEDCPAADVFARLLAGSASSIAECVRRVPACRPPGLKDKDEDDCI